jgi:hypothetical protein
MMTLYRIYATEETNRANERAPFANPGAAWSSVNVCIEDNGPGRRGIFIHVGVILIMQGSGDAKVTKEDSTIIVNEEVCCFDIPVNKAIYM